LRIKSSARKRKAISGILAGIIFFAMLFSAGLGFILYTFTSFNNYNKAQAAAIQNEQAKSAESLTLRSCDSSTYQLPGTSPYSPLTCSLGTGGIASASVWIQNNGGTSVTLVGIYISKLASGVVSQVEAPSAPPSTQTSPKAPYTINIGTASVINTNEALSLSSGVTYTIVFVSETGNTFSAVYPPSAPAPQTPAPKVTTLLSNTVIAPGSSVYDTAQLFSVTGNAGGTVTYYYYSNSACSVGQTQVSQVTVSNGVVPNSGSQTFSTPGYYSWQAVYSGDSNNQGATSPCEPLTVGPSITTTLSSSSINAGSGVTDSATLSGVTASAGGTVNYYYSASACPGSSPSSAGTVTVTNGVVPPSNLVTPASAGAYYFWATYSGDLNNPGPVTSSCELLIVLPAGTMAAALTTALNENTILKGGSAYDMATLSNVVAGAGGTIYFYYFDNSAHNDWQCVGTTGTGYSGTGQEYSAGTISTVNGPGQYGPSTTETFANAGTYSWEAVYIATGSSNPTATSPCESLTVLNTQTVTITTVLSANVIYQGGSVYDQAILSGVTSNAGGTVTYYYFATSGTCGSGQTMVGTVTVTNGVVPQSSAVSGTAFSVAGAYSWDAVYSGDPNNAGPVTSPCEPLLVEVPSSPTASGLGFLSFDFTSFQVYQLQASASTGCATVPTYGLVGGSYPVGCALGTGSSAYDVNLPPSQGSWATTANYYVFSIKVSSADAQGRSFKLDSNTFLQPEVICLADEECEDSSDPFAFDAAWELGCVNANGVILSQSTCSSNGAWTIPAYPSYTTIYWTYQLTQNPPTIVDSVGTWGIPDSLTTTPVFLFFHGTLGTSLYGENMPFASILWESVQPTTTTVTCGSGNEALCTATVTGYTGSVSGETISWSQSGTGSVVFPYGSTCTLSSSGTCSVTVSGVTAGSVTMTAYYPGDSSNAPSFGSATFAAVAGSFYITANPTAVEVRSGGSAKTSTITVTSLNSFTGTVSLSYSVSPSTGLTVGLSPASVTLGSSGTSTLTVSSSTAGTYAVTITATSGTFQVATTVTVTVVNFGLDPNSASHGSADSAGSPSSITISTTNPNDIIYACETGDYSGLTLGVSDSAGLTWTARTATTVSSSHGITLECWYAVAANPLASDVVSFTGSGGGYGGANYATLVFSVSGVNTAGPFDPNLNYAVTGTGGSGTTASVSITTTNANDMIIGVVGLPNTVTISAGSGYTLIPGTSTSGNSVASASDYKIVTSAQTPTSVSLTWSGNQYWAMIGDAFESMS
jgi:hypothetical protein